METGQESFPEKNRNHVVLKFTLLLFAILVLTFIAYESGMVHFFLSKKKMAGFLNSLGSWSFPAFILVQAFQVVAAPVPGDVTGILGGYLYGPWLGVIFSTIGLMIGSYLAFALSRAFGKPLVMKFVPTSTIKRFDFLLNHKRAFVVFVLFLLPGVPKDYLCYIVGLGGMSSLEFLVVGGFGRLFGTIVLTLGGNYLRLHQYAHLGILCAVVLILFLIGLAYRDKLERLFRFWHVKNLRSLRRRKSRLSRAGVPS